MAVPMPTAEEEKERTVPIAIVGASYAGLALANALHRRGVPYVVLELRMPPFAHVAGGSGFDVPSWDGVAKELALGSAVVGGAGPTCSQLKYHQRQDGPDTKARRSSAPTRRGGPARWAAAATGRPRRST